ncbi:MAG TPA: DUF2971 domain-containing protein [Nitrosopumilaceae archaeon]|nr:DUF2971 domain-containing protein [Nitrosopumilaceae archaeon]
MHDKNHPTFIAPENTDAKIWRFIDIEQFWSLLERESLPFARVTTFDDPYEGTLPEYNEKLGESVYSEFKDKFKDKEQFENFLKQRIPTMKNLYNELRKITLVNCWHLNEHESALMWKSYTDNHTGIAIQSTYRKLSDSFKNNVSDTVWIGKVAYSDFRSKWMNESNAYYAFVTKRISFESESELRAVTSLPADSIGKKILSNSDKEREAKNPTKPRVIDSTELTENGKLIKTDLDTLIEKIYITPFASDQFEKIVKSITEKMKPSLISRIKKSSLYTFD